MKNQGLGELRKRASTSRIVSVIILIYLSIDLLAKHDDFHLFRWLGSNVVQCKGRADDVSHCPAANGRREFAPDLTRTLLPVTRPSGIAANLLRPYLTARSTYHAPPYQLKRKEWHRSPPN